LCGETLVLHKGWIILRIKASAGPRHVGDVSRTVTDRLRINGGTGRHNAGGARLGDGGKNAVQRGLKANHLALHDLMGRVTRERRKGKKDNLRHTGLRGGTNVCEVGRRKV
jgi:hypothetical protein